MKKVYKFVVGVDEAGRGALAGPVVAAAVVLRRNTSRQGFWKQVRDSKLLSPVKRSQLAALIRVHSLDFGVGLASHREVDRFNIHNASLLAMRRAVERLAARPRLILVDGRFEIPLGLARKKTKQRAVVNGDETELVISAASIIAKVYRDTLMDKLAKKYPKYGFMGHKGYGTRSHMAKLKQHGPCAIHRVTFAPMRETAKI